MQQLGVTKKRLLIEKFYWGNYFRSSPPVDIYPHALTTRIRQFTNMEFLKEDFWESKDFCPAIPSAGMDINHLPKLIHLSLSLWYNSQILNLA